MKRILLGGYFGFGNVGDEAILCATVQGLRARLDDIEICVLSAGPAETAQAYNVEAADRWRLRDVWREMRRADLFVLGSGSLIQDVTSRLSPAYYLGLLSLARLSGTPYVAHAQGVGPLRSGPYRRWTRRALRRARSVTARDAISARTLREIGVAHPQVQVVADPAFCLAPEHAALADALLEVADLGRERPLLGAALRPFHGSERTPQVVAEALLQLARERGGAVAVLPFLRPGDLEPASEVYARLAEAGCPAKVVGADPTSPAAWAALIARLDLLVGMRLHALIFAVAQQTPAVALSYDPKVDAIAADASMPMLPAGLATSDELLAVCREALTSADATASARAEAAQRLRQRAEVGLDCLANAIREL